MTLAKSQSIAFAMKAQRRGLISKLNQFARERSTVADALTHCGLMTNSTGKQVSFVEPLTDIFYRYDENSIVNKAIQEAIPTMP